MKCLQTYEITQLETTKVSRKNEASYLCCIDRICQRFAVVERLEESIEALGRFNTSLLRFDMEECIHHLGHSSLEALGLLDVHHLRSQPLFLSAGLLS